MDTRKIKYITTFVVNYGTFAMGCSFFFLSSAVIDLSYKFETTVDQVSPVFTINTVAYLCGALSCGISYKYLNRQVVVICLFVVMSLSLILTPLCPTLLLLFITFAIAGFTFGGCDTALITWMIDIWGPECAPYVLTQNFAFGIGTFLPPLIFEPFLEHQELSSLIEIGSQVESFSSSNQTAALPTPIIRRESKLFLPFLIGGVIVGFSAVLLLLHYLTLASYPYYHRQHQQGAADEIEEEKKGLVVKPLFKRTKDQNSRGRIVILVLLSCFALGFYQAMELITIQFFPTFAVYSKQLALSEAQGAQILFVMTLTFAATRGLGIFIAFKISPELILLLNYIFLIVSNLILLIFAQQSIIALWIASILMGIGLSTVFPCYYAFIERHLHISDFLSSLFLVFGGSVSAIYPIIVGNAIETNPSVLCYVNFFSTGASTLAFALVYYLTVIKN